MLKKQYINRYIGILIFIITLTIYIKTLCPVIAPRDSGELTTAAFSLGIAHPPGYPLYVILGKFFSFIPFGSIAWRLNFMSAFFASLTIVLVFFMIFHITGNIIASIVSSLLLAFSPIFWSLALIAEVFQLNAFFTILTIYLLWLWKKERKKHFLLAFSFIFGLSLTHHHTMILLIPGFLYLIITTEKNALLNIKNFSFIFLFFIIGLLPYLFLPIRSIANPYLDWGNPENLKNFVSVITRAQYGSLKLDPMTPKDGWSFLLLFSQVKRYAIWTFYQFSPIGFLIGIIGIIIYFKNSLKTGIFLTVLFLLSGIGFVLISGYPLNKIQYYQYYSAMLRRFMLPSFLIFSIWTGIGISKISKIKVLKKDTRIIMAFLLFLPLISLFTNYKKTDKSKCFYTKDLSENILKSLEKNAIIFLNSDTTLFSLWYMQSVLGKRPDIKIISTTQLKWRAIQLLNRWPGLVKIRAVPGQKQKTVIQGKIESYKTGSEFLTDIIRTNIDKNPIYTDTCLAPKLNTFSTFLVPCGMVYQIIKSNTKEAKLFHLAKNKHLWQKYVIRNNFSKDYFTQEILDFYAEAHNFSGVVYLVSGKKDAAKIEFEKALQINPHYHPSLNNLRRLKFSTR